MKRILIVEDHDDMQMIYRYMFRDKSRHYAIETVANPLEALERLKKSTFDLLISDIVMVSMSGENLLDIVRKDKRHREMPILVVTVLKQEMLGQLRGMNRIYFLQKPITEEQLFQKIRAAVGGTG